MADKMYAVEVEKKQKVGFGKHAKWICVRVWGKDETELLGQRVDAVARFHQAQFQVTSGQEIEGIKVEKIRAVLLVQTDAKGAQVRELERWDPAAMKGAA